MAGIPAFILAYHDQVPEPEINKQLRFLASEYNRRRDEVEKSFNAQYANAKMQESLTGEPAKINVSHLLKNLENEYKLRAMELAEPHVEDKEKFKEIVNEHGPDSEYLKKIAESKELGERRKSDPAITSSQEKMLQMKQQQRQKEIEEIQKKFAKNKEVTKGREL